MKLKLLNVVVLAENYTALVDWYKEAFQLDVLLEETGDYNYTELGKDGKVIVGITPAKEMDHTLSHPRNNSSLMQLNVSDIKTLFKQVKTAKGKILFGPTKEEQHGFYYGAVADIEGNEIWVVEL